MKYQIKKGFLADADNNRVDLSLYDKSTAVKMLTTLTGCKDCVNCAYCKDCVGCLSCQNCNRCTDCTICNFCTNVADGFNKTKIK